MIKFVEFLKLTLVKNRNSTNLF